MLKALDALGVQGFFHALALKRGAYRDKNLTNSDNELTCFNRSMNKCNTLVVLR